MDDLETIFMTKWVFKRDNIYYLTKLSTLKKNNSENVVEFIATLNQMNYIIIEYIRPTKEVVRDTYEKLSHLILSSC